MNKRALIQAIRDAIQADFDNLRRAAQKTRAEGNDAESKAEGKYDTRSTEDNYLADGFSRQAHTAAQAGTAYENFQATSFGDGRAIDLGALVQLAFADGSHWFFIGPAGGGIEVVCEGEAVTILTPESRLGKQLVGLKKGGRTASPAAEVRSVE